jgi:hypothetical protein
MAEAGERDEGGARYRVGECLAVCEGHDGITISVDDKCRSADGGLFGRDGPRRHPNDVVAAAIRDGSSIDAVLGRAVEREHR